MRILYGRVSNPPIQVCIKPSPFGEGFVLKELTERLQQEASFAFFLPSHVMSLKVHKTPTFR